MWAADGRTLYFMSDRGGQENLWAQPLSGLGRAATRAAHDASPTAACSGRASARDGRAIVFERDFAVWRYDVGRGQARRGARSRCAARRRGRRPSGSTPTSGFQELRRRPDGKKIAFVVRGEVFAASARPESGDVAFRVTTTPALERGARVEPRQPPLAYASRSRRTVAHLRSTTSRLGSETATHAAWGGTSTAGDASPRWSPDGRTLAYTRDGRELRAVEVATGRDRRRRRPPRSTGRRSPSSATWRGARTGGGSPSRSRRARSSSRTCSLSAVPAAGGVATPRPVSFVRERNGGEVRWAPTAATCSSSRPAHRADAARARRPRAAHAALPRGPVPRSVRDAPPCRADGPRHDARLAAAHGARARRHDRRRRLADGDSARADAARRRTTDAVGHIVFDGIRTRLLAAPRGLDVGDDGARAPTASSSRSSPSVAGQTNRLPRRARRAGADDGRRASSRRRAGPKSDAAVVAGRQGASTTARAAASRRRPSTRAPCAPIAVAAEMDVDFAAEKHGAVRARRGRTCATSSTTTGTTAPTGTRCARAGHRRSPARARRRSCAAC